MIGGRTIWQIYHRVANRMDNRIFNVNGPMTADGKDLLAATLRLAFQQMGHPGREGNKAIGYRVCSRKGFILYRYPVSNCVLFPCSLSSDQVLPTILAWFDSKPDYTCEEWDEDHDHDGHNGPGWRVYCEDWGFVDDEYQAFLAVKPAFMWYGK